MITANEIKTFEDFTRAMSRALHDALLTGGSNEMRRELYTWLPYFLSWSAETKTESAKKEKKKPRIGPVRPRGKI